METLSKCVSGLRVESGVPRNWLLPRGLSVLSVGFSYTLLRAELIAFGGGHFLVLINSQESDTYKLNANLQREIEMLMRLNCFVDMVSMILPEDIYTQKLNSNQKMA